MTEISWNPADDKTTAGVAHFGGAKNTPEGPPSEDEIHRGKEAIEAAIDKIQTLSGTRVELRSLTPGISGASVFRATAEREARFEQDCVLKIGPAKLLAKEADRYLNLVHGHVRDSGAKVSYQHDIKSVAEDKLVAIQYEDAGRTTFGEHLVELICKNDVASACDAIDDLLAILRPWQQLMKVNPKNSLAHWYNFKDFTPDADPKMPGTFELLMETCKALDLDEIDWLAKVKDFWRPKRLTNCRVLTTAVHGDLHTDNVMVGDDGKLKMIDFGSVEKDGHFLRDLCTMEAHFLLRARVADPNLDLDEYLDELEELYDPEFLLDPFAGSADKPTSAVIARVRRYALACLMNGDTTCANQYAFAVLRHAIRIGIRTEQEGTSERERRAAIHVTKLLSSHLELFAGQAVLSIARSSRRPSRSLSFLDGKEGRWVDGVPAPGVRLCDGDAWRELADELLSSHRVEFLGLVPLPLVDALLVANQVWTDDRTSRYIRINYVLPERIRFLGAGSYRYANPRWLKSLTGMHNLLTDMIDSGRMPREGYRPFQMSSRVTDNCLIRVEGQDRSEKVIYEISRLSQASLGSGATFTLNRIENDPSVSNWISDTLEPGQREALFRECVCALEPEPYTYSSQTKAQLRPLKLSALTDASERRVRGLRPVVVTVLRSMGPDGPCVIMKRRNKFDDHNEFGVRSFLKTPVLAEDVARGGADARPVAYEPARDLREDYRHLWDLTGQKDDWVIDFDAFRHAAQRDVYSATLLEIQTERFVFSGQKFVDCEEPGSQTCFVVFAVDLEPDEEHVARESSRNLSDGLIDTMEIVPSEEVFAEQSVSDSDVFITEQRDWLRPIVSNLAAQQAGSATRAHTTETTWLSLIKIIPGATRVIDLSRSDIVTENLGNNLTNAAGMIRLAPDATAAGVLAGSDLRICWISQLGSLNHAPPLNLNAYAETNGSLRLLAVAKKDAKSVLCLVSDAATTFVLRIRPFETARRQRVEYVREVSRAPASAGVLWDEHALLVSRDNSGNHVCECFPGLTHIAAIDAAFSGASLLVAALGEGDGGAMAVHFNGDSVVNVPRDAVGVGLVRNSDLRNPPSTLAVVDREGVSYREVRGLRYEWATQNGSWL